MVIHTTSLPKILTCYPLIIINFYPINLTLELSIQPSQHELALNDLIKNEEKNSKQSIRFSNSVGIIPFCTHFMINFIETLVFNRKKITIAFVHLMKSLAKKNNEINTKTKQN